MPRRKSTRTRLTRTGRRPTCIGAVAQESAQIQPRRFWAANIQQLSPGMGSWIPRPSTIPTRCMTLGEWGSFCFNCRLQWGSRSGMGSEPTPAATAVPRRMEGLGPDELAHDSADLALEVVDALAQLTATCD